MAERIGVDFGTSHTVAVVGPTPLLFDSSPLLPSAVFADGTGRLLTGRDAHRSGHLDPSRWEPNPKRRIDDGVLLLGEHEVPVRHAIGAVLARVGEEAKRTLGAPPAEAVLTFPAGWAAVRRGVLTDAAAAARFGPVRLVPEPVAAASYFTTTVGHQVPPGSAVVVYDFGAGTFDVSVLRRAPTGGWDVVATDGLSDVGGLDLDAAIVEFVGARVAAVDPTIWARLTSPAGTAEHRHRRLLWEDARAVKEQLSREASATLVVPIVDRDVIVTRAEFDTLAKPWIERTVNLTTSTLFRSGVTADRVVGLFLVGGSSRIPLVATMLHRALGTPPVVLEQPELVVAKGSLVATEAPAGSPAPPVGPVAPISAAPISAAPVSPMPAPVSPPVGPPVSPPVGPSPTGPAPVGPVAVGRVAGPAMPQASVPQPSAQPHAAWSAPVGTAPVGTAPVGTAPVGTASVAPSPVGASAEAPGRPWIGRGVTAGVVALALILVAASDSIRYAVFYGAATVLRPATVLPFLATVLVLAGAGRSAPRRPLATVWFGAVSGLTAALVFVSLVKLVEWIRPEIDSYTIEARFDHASWIVSVVAGVAIVAGLVLLALRGIPIGSGRRTWIVAVGAGIVPGVSAYTSVWWRWFAEQPDDAEWAPLRWLPRYVDPLTTRIVVGLVIGWAVAMVAAALAGRAVGETVAPGTRRVLHRTGALVLVAAGAVLVYFMQVERRQFLDRDDTLTVMRAIDRHWNDLLGARNPGLLAVLVLAVAAAAGIVVVLRAQSQTRSGGS